MVKKETERARGATQSEVDYRIQSYYLVVKLHCNVKIENETATGITIMNIICYKTVYSVWNKCILCVVNFHLYFP